MISLVSDVGNMTGTAIQFAFPDHVSDLAELLALAERALLVPNEKRRGAVSAGLIFYRVGSCQANPQCCNVRVTI